MSYKSTKAWRKKNPSKWQTGKKRYYKQFEKNALNKHKRWTAKDIQLIIDHKILDREIAVLTKRSVKAIQTKRNRLKYNLF